MSERYGVQRFRRRRRFRRSYCGVENVPKAERVLARSSYAVLTAVPHNATKTQGMCTKAYMTRAFSLRRQWRGTTIHATPIPLYESKWNTTSYTTYLRNTKNKSYQPAWRTEWLRWFRRMKAHTTNHLCKTCKSRNRKWKLTSQRLVMQVIADSTICKHAKQIFRIITLVNDKIKTYEPAIINTSSAGQRGSSFTYLPLSNIQYVIHSKNQA